MKNKAYAEVYQIIQYLPEEEYRRIPEAKIKFFEENMDKNLQKIYTIGNSIEQIELSEEAKIIFISLFYNYIANDDQKVKLRNYIAKKEKDALDDSYKKIFANPKEIKEDIDKSSALIVIPKESIFTKIKKILFKLINKE